MNKFRLMSVFVVLAMLFSFVQVSPAGAATTTVTLQESTATISQPQDGLFVYEAVDGITVGQDGNGLNGWATWNGSSTAQTAVWETASDVNASQLDFTLYHTWAASHSLGRFRLSYTTDDRSTFADGLTAGGDVTANWTVLTGATVSGTGGETFTELGDNSILVSGNRPATTIYSVNFTGNFSGVTGIRLEAIPDASLPQGGAGRGDNGNWHLIEITLDATTAPNPLYPESCQDIRDTNPSATDGDYVIYPNNQVFTIYCHDMVGTPSEYLSLVNTGGGSNFSQYTAGGAAPGTNAITHYTKVRLDPNTLLVDINDKTFTSSTGSLYHGGFGYVTDTDYATAMDCLYGGSSSGQGNVDLTGTRFAVVDTFAPDGWIPAGSAAFSSDDQVVDLQGGGYCGWISPARRPAHDPLSNDVAYVLALRYLNGAPTAVANGPYLVAVGQQVILDSTGSSDPDGDSLTKSWSAYGGTVSGNIYTAGSVPGIYDVQLIVNDGAVDSLPATTMVVVYDPSAGFVTGGGWIDSPVNANYQYMQTGGKANFGFVAKYKNGANVPDGNTQFQFKAGDLNFHSSSYEWLVVAGNKAQFKGEGTINGQGSYKFMITADDDSPDTFRIKIWNEENGLEVVVYDNGSQQSLGGGSIKVHK